MNKLLLLLTLCASLFIISCGDDDDFPIIEFMTATIDGDSFEATTLTAIKDTIDGTPVVFINGGSENFESIISLFLPSDIGISTLSIDTSDFEISFTNLNQNLFSTVGTLKITKNENNRLEGEFDFTATNIDNSTDVRVITDGVFKANY